MAERPGVAAGHPLLEAVAPLADRLGAELVPASDLRAGDVPLAWEGEVVGGVRLPAGVGEEVGESGETGESGLPALVAAVADELGGPLAELPRAEKQRAVRLLEERGAFSYRQAAETIAEALGVTRFTVYNYLNRQR